MGLLYWFAVNDELIDLRIARVVNTSRLFEQRAEMIVIGALRPLKIGQNVETKTAYLALPQLDQQQRGSLQPAAALVLVVDRSLLVDR